MKQIYVGSTEKVYLNVFLDGALINADSPPTFSLTIVGSDADARTGTSINESTGTYYFLTDFSEVEIEQTLRVEWTYLVSTDSYTRVDYISVVTPYANFADLRDLAPVGTSDLELENAELFARYMINNYTGQNFGQRLDAVKMHGSDRATLVLPYRIIRLDSIEDEEELVWQRDPEINDFGKNVEITDTNYGLRLWKYDNVPVWSEFVNYPYWSKSRYYTLSGLYGYEDVPDEVEYCARLLADDYFCKETAWKKRFVQQMNASDWRVVFSPKQFQGTGNFFVDQILSDFRSINMVAI